jgi:hypothetical protein
VLRLAAFLFLDSISEPRYDTALPQIRSFVMFVLKGILLGAAMFFAFSIVYVWAWFGPFSSKKAIGVAAIHGVITHNVLYWITGILMLALGCVIMANWPHRVLN